FNFFFFQAEDGIRDRNVTRVQTCALPIYMDEELQIDEKTNDEIKETYDELKKESEELPDFDELKEDLKKQLETQKKAEKLEAKLEKLKEDATIEKKI